jgi:hypothetical protein
LVDRDFEEREVVLSECAGRKKNIDAANLFPNRGFASEMDHVRSENRIRPLGLRVEEEALKTLS